jgi:hypothetical protein
VTSEAIDLVVIEDHTHKGDWRVEWHDDDGGCYVTIFTGRAAEARARAYVQALKSGILSTLIPDKVS